MQEKPKGDVKPVLQIQNVSAEEKANHLPCPLGVKEEGIRLNGLRDKEGRKQGSAGAYGSGFSG